MAYDLGKRLLPAFATPTGLPYARVSIICVGQTRGLTYPQLNLRHGVQRGETLDTCWPFLCFRGNISFDSRYRWGRFFDT